MAMAGREPWICGACRSVNEFKSQRCYKCRTPRELGEADVSQLITAGAGASEATATAAQAARTAALGGYRSSNARAGLTQCLLAATAILAVVSSVAGADLIGRALVGDTENIREDAAIVVAIGLAVYAAAGATLISWAAWQSRVVDNVPKVGLGWPSVSPGQAVLENFLPGWNLFRVPAILRDVVTRLEPNHGRGNTLIAVAWLGLVGGVLLPYAARWFLTFVPMPVPARVNAAVIVAQLALGVTIAGIVFLVLLIRHIEAGMRARRRSSNRRRAIPHYRRYRMEAAGFSPVAHGAATATARSRSTRPRIRPVATSRGAFPALVTALVILARAAIAQEGLRRPYSAV